MKVIKSLSISVLFVCLTCSTLHAQDLMSVFGSMPDPMVLPLDSLQRLDIIDMYKAGQKAQIVNNLNDTCKLQSYSDNYMELKSGNSTLVLALLPMINDSKILCVIKTVCAPVCDSRLEFYTTEWKPLDSTIFIRPVDKSWFFKDNIDRDSEQFKSFEATLDMNLMQYQLDKNNLSLTQSYNTPQYISLEYKQKVKDYIKSDPKIYHWKQVRFE